MVFLERHVLHTDDAQPGMVVGLGMKYITA